MFLRLTTQKALNTERRAWIADREQSTKNLRASTSNGLYYKWLSITIDLCKTKQTNNIIDTMSFQCIQHFCFLISIFFSIFLIYLNITFFQKADRWLYGLTSNYAAWVDHLNTYCRFLNLITHITYTVSPVGNLAFPVKNTNIHHQTFSNTHQHLPANITSGFTFNI